MCVPVPRETRKRRKRRWREKRRGIRRQWVWVADRCRDGGWVFVWRGGGLDGFWCVINQQHLPWHCLDSRLRAALLCCALLPLSAAHLSPPPRRLSICPSPYFLSRFSSSLPSALFPSSLSLSPQLFLLLFLYSFFSSLLISAAFLFNPFSSTLSLTLSLHFNCPDPNPPTSTTVAPTPPPQPPSVVRSTQTALSVGVGY